MPGVTYDTGALIAAESNDRRVWALHAAFLAEEVVPTVPAPVLAEAWLGGSRQASLARFLALCGIAPLTEQQAEAVGALANRATTMTSSTSPSSKAPLDPATPSSPRTTPTSHGSPTLPAPDSRSNASEWSAASRSPDPRVFSTTRGSVLGVRRERPAPPKFGARRTMTDPASAVEVKHKAAFTGVRRSRTLVLGGSQKGGVCTSG